MAFEDLHTHELSRTPSLEVNIAAGDNQGTSCRKFGYLYVSLPVASSERIVPSD